ncbi:AraC family transcriptional regulator [Gorillibacterium massiliense]|uniref:AraC family transcriptional regulator n=1 Tax=Gorillibacterium massiliense TaxID=1280390 RepID=UPI0004B6F3D8|nr:AraC family transcriptional regulator [Gorillibacterium massiliense]
MEHLWTEGKKYYSGYRLRMEFDTENIGHDDSDVPSSYRIALVVEGTGLVQVGDVIYPVITPSLYCINEKDRIRFKSDTSLKIKSIWFSPNVIHDRLTDLLEGKLEGEEVDGTDFQDLWILEPFTERSGTDYGCMLLDNAVAKYMEGIMEEIGKNLTIQPDFHWPCRSRSYLMELLFRIRLLYQNSRSTPAAIPQTGLEPISPIIEYLHMHYGQKIKVEDLTSRFLVNRTTLNKWFNQSTGLSVITYLCRLRLQIAEMMLRNTKLPVSEILAMVGFQDDAHFIRQFRKYSGYSPADYRVRFCTM